jgi:hypothetical protein
MAVFDVALPLIRMAIMVFPHKREFRKRIIGRMPSRLSLAGRAACGG